MAGDGTRGWPEMGLLHEPRRSPEGHAPDGSAQMNVPETIWYGRVPLRVRLHSSAHEQARAVVSGRGVEPVPALYVWLCESTDWISHVLTRCVSLSYEFDAYMHVQLMASRCSYLPLLTATVRKYFVERGVDYAGSALDIWYSVDLEMEREGQGSGAIIVEPLRWYDLL